VIFNPSFGWRVAHMLAGVLVSAAFMIAGISAWYLIKDRHLDVARRGLSIALGSAAILLPVQMYLGDAVAVQYIEKYQMPKLEALEGNWTSTNTGWIAVVIPDQAAAKNSLTVTVPWLGSAIAGDWTGRTPTPGLLLTPPALRPNVLATFYGFRVMFYGSLVMFAAAMMGVVLRLRGRLYTARWFHRLVLVALPMGVLAIIGGWVLAETGRQPWIVYGKLLTADAVSPLHTWPVVGSLSLFVVVYGSLVGAYIYYVVRVVRQGPEGADDPDPGRVLVPPRPAVAGRREAR